MYRAFSLFQTVKRVLENEKILLFPFGNKFRINIFLFGKNLTRARSGVDKSVAHSHPTPSVAETVKCKVTQMTLSIL